LDNTDLTSVVATLGLANIIFGTLAFLFVGIIPVFCFWRIYDKAGYSPKWSLFAFIPGAQIILLIAIALLEW
jgi:hypothetical protein